MTIEMSYDTEFEKLISGVITAISQTIDLTGPNSGTDIVQITGSWSGTIIAEGSNDGTNFLTIPCIDQSNGQELASITSSGMYIIASNGYNQTRIRSSAWSTGTATISAYGSNYPSIVYAAEDKNYGTSGVNTLRTASQIGNSGGAADFNSGATGAQTLRTVANQGAPNSATNGWTVKPTDGTNSQSYTIGGEAKVSVTQPLPSGTNAIGSITNTSFIATQSTAANLNATVVGTGTFAVQATQSGTWTVQPGNTANTTPWLVTDSSDGPVIPGTVAGKSSLSGGQYNTSLPTVVNVQQVALQVDSSGRLIVVPTGTVTANQGSPNTLSNAWPEKITDGTNVASVSIHNDIGVVDGLASGGLFGNLTLTTSSTAYEAKADGARLAGRKSLTIMPIDSDMYWGYSSSVTISNGTPIFKNQFMEFSLDPTDSNAQIWLVCSASNKNARITESQ